MTEASIPTDSDGHEPMRKGALGAWWWQGTRSALLLKPDWSGLQATPANIAWLVVVPYALGVLLQRLFIDGPATFHWPAVVVGWLSTAVAAWVCWLLVPRPSSGDAPQRAPSAAALFAMLAAQGLTFDVLLALVYVPMVRGGSYSPEVLGRWGWWAAWGAPMVWIAAAQIRLVWVSGPRRIAPRAIAVFALAGVLVLSEWVQPLRFWYPAAPPRNAAEDVRPFVLTQDMMEQQPQVLARRLQEIKPGRRGAVNLYVITFAPYAQEDVFRREADMVANVMRERFDAAGRTIELVNHRDTVGEWPWATPLNLQRAIQRVAAVMNRDEDVLFIHLTSHGAKDGMLSARFWPMTIEPVQPVPLKAWLDAAGIRYRIVSVSACYSGSWIAPLADAGTLVMTAADAEHTSYGCGRYSELTYFGRAMYDEQIRQGTPFEAAHAQARRVIERREREAGKSDGYSNPQIAVGEAIRSQLARLEARRVPAAAP